ncbi:MAG: alpha/beta fold hydrolase, partial [Pseudomonadota bacterium]
MTTRGKKVPAQDDLSWDAERATRWLSRGLEELILERAAQRLLAEPAIEPAEPAEPVADFSVVIVGSGYGGAVAAAELSALRGADKTVCVLERGREYLQGSFPTRMADLAAHVRFAGGDAATPKGYREGLFDVRIGTDVSAVVANGVGGGSLINAGVMLMPTPDVFTDPAWPKALRQQPARDQLDRCSAELTARLGATHTVASDGVRDPTPHKYDVLGQLAPERFGAVPITVALADGTQTSAGVPMDTCVRCGDCATGCNHNAKLSLDVTLLAEAVRNGAQIFAGATVLRIEKLLRKDGTPLWNLHLVHTDENLRRRQGVPFVLRAERVVLAAGTLGSTEILMRSENETLRFSPRLGHRFSANGDMIAAAYDTQVDAVDCVGDETVEPASVPPADRVGPTITGLIDLRGDKGDGVAIQDLGVPGALRRLFEEVVTTSAALHLLGESDERLHGPGDALANDPCAIDADRVRKSLLVVMMSRDPADGLLTMNRDDTSPEAGDGALSIHWPRLRDHPPFLAQHVALQDMLDRSPVKGRVLPNPIWRPLPAKLDYLFEGATGPLLTVHPLGGCPMGDTAMSGVVDATCRVFDPAAPAVSDDEEQPVHDGLVVLDGSVIPTSLGINPALTIASVALRAVRALCVGWGFTQPCEQTPLPPRPVFRMPPAREKPEPTRVEVLERLSGPLRLAGRADPVHAELTMHFEPIALRELMVPGTRLALSAARGKLRIFSTPPGVREEKTDDDPTVLLVADVSGSLRVFHQEASTPLQRRLRSLSAWVRNRGVRDTVQWVQDRWLNGASAANGSLPFKYEVKGRVRSAWQLGSRAGAVRLMDYELTVGDAVPRSCDAGSASLAKQFQGQPIRGEKRLTYSRKANPWRQLMEVKLSVFPGLAADTAGRAGAVLRLDPAYLANQGMPLLRIVRQQDQPSALVDMASLGLYVLRILLHVHVWSFRAPDKPLPREIRRLPGSVKGLPSPVVVELPVAAMQDGRPVMVRLTHYPFGEAQRTATLKKIPDVRAAVETPVLLIHGYSASGTTFAHHAVQPNLAGALWDAGRDVWIIDMRTSAGMPHAQHPWRFEEVARADIPVAIGHVLASTGKAKIDVFAHCMGSAMLGMALLGPKHAEESFWPLREGLHAKIRSLVISQVPPAMIFTPDNVFRAYVMRYVSHFLALDGFQFRVSESPGLAEQLADRLLATLPYPESEFDRENPLWPPWRRTPWVATRHRMDALYGRDFSVNNVSDEMLAHIDDHFGPLSLQTVSQVIHFARFRSIADRQGFNEFVSPNNLRENYDFPVMCVHGEDNGLVSVETLDHFKRVMAQAGRPVRLEPIAGFGHQDCLIGTGARPVFDKVIRFFDSVARLPALANESPSADEMPPAVYACQVPTLGLRLDITGTAGPTVRLAVGDDGGRGRPLFGAFMPVAWVNGRLQLAGLDGTFPPTGDALRSVAMVLKPMKADEDDNTHLPFAFKRPVLPDAAEGLLVMLIYGQSPLIGAASPLRHDKLAHIAPVAEAVDLEPEMIDALLAAWKRSSDATLESGVLRLPDASLVGASAPDGPSPAGDRCFVLASCQYPGGILDRTPPGMPRDAQPGPSDASYLRLRDRLDANAKNAATASPVPSFLVLAGDQVYVDATAGLFDARGLDDQFRVPYESFLGARGPRAVLGRLPAYMLMDDHEIVDNWEADPAGASLRKPSSNDALRQRGVAEFRKYQRRWDFPSADTDALFSRAELDGLAFFFADSRLERAPRLVADALRADIMGEPQARAIDAWLAQPSRGGPRFFVSSAMVLPRLLDSRSMGRAVGFRSDAWDGYPVALHRLLAGVFERGTSDVVFLSGDAHLGNVTRIVLTRDDSDLQVVAHSVHCPALYAPYPFANAVPDNFARVDAFAFEAADAGGVTR